MAIVKASGSVSAARIDLADFGARAELIVAEASQRAARMLDEARAERERLLETAAAEARESGEREGYRAGLERGRKEGRELAQREAAEELSALVRGLGEALAGFERERGTLLARARDDLLLLAIRLSEQITRRRLAVEPEIVTQQVNAAIEAVSHASELTVAVHPDDEAIVRDALGDWAGVAIARDASVERGGCVVRCGRGVVADATIGTQLERIARAILPAEGSRGVAA